MRVSRARVTTAPVTAESQRDYDSVTESIEARYTAQNWNLYRRAVDSEDLTQIERDFEWKKKYRSSSSCAIPMARFATQIFHRCELVSSVTGERRHPVLQEIHENHYDHTFDTTPTTPAVTVIPLFCATTISTSMISHPRDWRPNKANVTFVSRYDFQMGTIDTRGDSCNLESANITAHILSEAITGTPLPRLYFRQCALL